MPVSSTGGAGLGISIFGFVSIGRETGGMGRGGGRGAASGSESGSGANDRPIAISATRSTGLAGSAGFPCFAAAAASEVPSFLQNLAFGGFNSPQVGQVTEPGIAAWLGAGAAD